MPEGAAPRGRRNRVTRSGDFDAVYRRGTSAAGRHLVVYAFNRGEGDSARLGLSVGRRVGGAVERNRVKRVLREQFATLQSGRPAGIDYVVINDKQAADNGEMVIALLDGSGATVKRDYRERDGRIRLQPANETMQPMFVHEDDVRIQGIVVGVLRRY